MKACLHVDEDEIDKPLQCADNRCLSSRGDGSTKRQRLHPNMIFILIDDLRWDELGIAGHPYLKTPPGIEPVRNLTLVFAPEGQPVNGQMLQVFPKRETTERSNRI